MQETVKPNVQAQPRNWLRSIAAGSLVGLSSVVSCISFVAIVYADALSMFLDRGIGLLLLGGSIAAVVGAFLLTYRGTVNHTQDVTAILIAVGAAGIVQANPGFDPETLFATVAMFTIIAAVSAGLVCIALGKFGLSYLVRFIPYPMLGGFLAATGYLLLLGSISVASGLQLDLWTLPVAFAPGTLMTWAPWLLGGLVVAIVSHRFKGDAILPMCIVAILLAFYGVLWISGTGLDEAALRGLLLGPFSSGSFVDELSIGFPLSADYGAIFGQAPAILAVIAMTVLGGLLNTQGLSFVTGQESRSDHDLAAIGWGNVLGGGAGGLVSYPALGDSIIAYRSGLRGPAAGLSVAVFSILILALGANVLAVLPKGLFGLILSYLGFDLVYTWLWSERRRLPRRDFAIVLIVLATAATIGFLEAIALGFVLSMLLFIVSYSRVDPVRHEATLATRRSMVERGPLDRAALTRLGEQVIVIELTGYLFFGTATDLRERVLSVVRRAEVPPLAIALDFRRVPDIDASAISALVRMTEFARDKGITMIFAGLNDIAKLRLQRFAKDIQPRAMPEYFDSLEEALQALEWLLLNEEGNSEIDRGGFLAALEAACPDLRVRDFLTTRTFEDGTAIVTQGEASQDMFVIIDGAARAVVTPAGSDPIVVARFLPGAVVGEMAYYGDAPRTATVIAEGETTVVQVDAAALEANGAYPVDLRVAIHKTVAGYMSRRLGRVTRLLHQSLS